MKTGRILWEFKNFAGLMELLSAAGAPNTKVTTSWRNRRKLR